ncbi:MAG: hypothetical protein BroJett038_23620 [Chloroflexota bacterium]|nr:MAG: hypothetical protein BroJett038_23620 [Chloroflexota bacterium]
MREFAFQLQSGHKNAYDVHQKIWDVVRMIAGDGAKFLFRAIGDVAKVRIVSPVRINGGREAVMPVDGERYKFCVLVNPMRRVGHGSRREPVSSVDAAREITVCLLSNGGFDVEQATGEFVSGPFFGKPGMKDFVIRSFNVWGVVRVRDEKKAREAIATGIGRSRRFGYGMIDLEKAQ